jgi:hypothetical protein
VPRHPASPRYLRNVNVSNAIIDNHARITNVARNRVRDLGFENRDAPGAVTTVRGSALDAQRAAPGRFRAANPREPARPVNRESVAALVADRASNRTRDIDERARSARRPTHEPQFPV